MAVSGVVCSLAGWACSHLGVSLWQSILLSAVLGLAIGVGTTRL